MSSYPELPAPPEPYDPDLPDHLRAISKHAWLDLILRMDIPTNRKMVAFALARFGNPDGTRVFPGQAKTGDMAGQHETNSRKHIKALLELGMLVVKRRGGGRGGAPTVYRLTRPADITTLPLWLDAHFDRIPAGTGFVPLATPEHRAPELGEKTAAAEHRVPELGETPTEHRVPAPGENTEHRALTLAETPVDNSGAEETPSDPHGNTERFGPKHGALALPDPYKTHSDQTFLGSPQATTSPDKITGPQSAGGSGHGIPAHIPAIITGTASLLPDPDAYAAAHAVLAALPDFGEFFQAAATRDLRTAGDPDPPIPAIVVRAAQIAAQAESRSA